MTRFQTLLAACAALIALPAFAHDGVHISDPYARVNGGIGATGAIFLQIENHADVDERLLDVKSPIAEKVELHSHTASADGVMQMRAIEGGIAIAPLQGHDLKRGGDHIMLMGLKQALKDGDMIPLTLVFEHAGEVQIEVPVDNARKPEAMGAMGTMDHSTMDASKMPSN
jgi:periplasmic copper chaperone A